MGITPKELAEVGDRPLDFVTHSDPAIRRLALSAMASEMANDGLRSAALAALTGDAEARVRAEAAEVLGGAGAAATESLLAALGDPSALVIEAAVTALGELADPATVDVLSGLARDHADKLVREAAVAALGAIGDDTALPLLLELATTGAPQIRRRSLVALSVFEGSEVDAVLNAALEDRNPMVREAAEMVARD
ncbi:MAG: HEAT repeat domain-containing protein [Acidimicrobiia bacterium]|nr:HEAT repeat domain-containing protein [Acidimicrobiia bacterium]MDH3470946.1 HEAT repeat domain-containing protein [Acidimicrobiia bacterium]